MIWPTMSCHHLSPVYNGRCTIYNSYVSVEFIAPMFISLWLIDIIEIARSGNRMKFNLL